MQFYIHKHVPGTEKHLRISDGEFSWSPTVPPDAWQFGDSGAIKSIDDLIKLYGRQVEGFDKIPEYIFFRDLGMLPGDVQWHSVLTKERYSGIMTSIINAVQSSLEFSKTDPYIETSQHHRVTRTLEFSISNPQSEQHRHVPRRAIRPETTCSTQEVAPDFQYHLCWS